MGKVKYDQKGYTGQSMSKRAVLAYEAGEKPISKLTAADKDFLNEVITCYAPESGLFIESMTQFKAIMKKWGESSYHHTGKYANITSFYHPCGLFDIYDAQDWQDHLTEEKIRGFGIRMAKAAQLIKEGQL